MSLRSRPSGAIAKSYWSRKANAGRRLAQTVVSTSRKTVCSYGLCISATGFSAHDVLGLRGMVFVTIRSSDGQPLALAKPLRSAAAASVMMLSGTPGEWSAIDAQRLCSSRK